MSNIIKNTKMFLTSGDNNGCFAYRTKYPAEMLGKEYSAGYPVDDKRIKDSDVIQIQRATSEYFIDAIPSMQKEGKKFIYDIDDNLWEIPSYNPAYRPYNRHMLNITKQIIGLCDVVTVSTEPLKKYFIDKGFNDNIFVIPNFMHHLPEYRESINNDVIVIGYVGTATHSGDFDSKLVKAIIQLLDKYSNLEFRCMGYNPLPYKNHPQIKFTPFVPIDEYNNTMYNLNIDIGIAPLINNEFNRCKSNIKFLEYSSNSTVTIASNVYPYSNTIINNETGILIEDNKDWYSKLEMLISDVSLRKRLSKNAYSFVDANFTYKNNNTLIDDLYTQVLESIYE